MPSVPTSDKVVIVVLHRPREAAETATCSYWCPPTSSEPAAFIQVMHACATRPGETKLQVTISEDEQAGVSLATSSSP